MSLRPRGGKVTVTDGPHAVAAKHPVARLNEHLGWGVEIRPIEVCQVAAAAAAVAP